MDTFKVRIRQLREDKELTQEELAKVLGISRATLASWEIGRREPDFETASKIADFFGVSVDYLLGRTDDPHLPGKTKPQTEKTLEEDWPEVVNVLRRAGKKPTLEERRRIARIIKAAIEDTEEENEE